jgi:membrane associated rhomboid family serine protease
MLILLPLGVEDHRVDRVPWVSLAIAGTCLAAYLATAVAGFRSDTETRPLEDLTGYWLAHPYLAPPDGLPPHHLGPRFDRMLALQIERVPAPAAWQIAEEQAQLATLARAAMEARGGDPLLRFGLVPARGAAQIGWLTHMFLHAGLFHLLGNLLFFYLVGPLLEDAWGRPLFAIFYLVGGIAAALAQVALNPGSTVPMVGASGAIAACMGAFSVRYAKRNITLGYFLWILRIFRGTFEAPAWLCAAAWLGSQLWSLWVGGQSGVALMAHIGGFGFGLAVAVALRSTGIETKYVAPAVEKKVAWVPQAEVVQAQEALSHGDPEAAARAYRRLLAKQPENREALVGLATIELAANRRAAAAPLVERAVRTAFQRAPEQAWDVIGDLGAHFHPEDLSPPLAFRLASSQSAAPDGLWHLLEPLWVAAGSGGGALGAKALLRAVQLRIERQDDPTTSLAYLERIRREPELPEELRQRAAAFEMQLRRNGDG